MHSSGINGEECGLVYLLEKWLLKQSVYGCVSSFPCITELHRVPIEKAFGNC